MAPDASGAADRALQRTRLLLKQLKLASEELELQLSLIRSQQATLEQELTHEQGADSLAHQLQAQSDVKAQFASEEIHLATQYNMLQSQFALLQGRMQHKPVSHRYTASDPTWMPTTVAPRRHAQPRTDLPGFPHSKLSHTDIFPAK